MTKCTFCQSQANLWTGEKIFYEDSLIVIARARNLKGHQERLIAVVRMHQDFNKPLEAYLVAKLKEVGAKVFKQSFIILEDTFSRFPNHAHKCASLLDPKASDYQQILNTEFTNVRVD